MMFTLGMSPNPGQPGIKDTAQLEQLGEQK